MLIPDETLQGSMVQVYDLVTGIRYDGHGWDAPPYMDSFPYLLAAEFGSNDVVIAKPTGTITLSSTVNAGDSTVTFTGATGIQIGNYFTVGSASNGTLETHRIATITPSFTVSEPFINTQASGSAVTFLTTHRFTVVNNAYGSGNQPPSVTITDFDGQEWRQITAAQMDELTIKGNGTSLVDYTTTFMGNPATQFPTVNGVASAVSNTSPFTVTIPITTYGFSGIVTGSLVDGPGLSAGGFTVTNVNAGSGVITISGTPGTLVVGGTYTFSPAAATFSSSFGSVQTPAPWSFYVKLGGTYSPTITDWEVSFKRGTKPIPALTGQQQYYTYFAGPLQATGKFTFIEQAGSPQLNSFLNALTQSFDMTLFDQKQGTALNIFSTKGQYKTGEIDRSKEYVTVVVEFQMLPTSTDALAGGVSPCVVSVANSTTTPYYSGA
jgi:hypothetical protein